MTPDELARQEARAFAEQGMVFRPLAASAYDPDDSIGKPTGLPEIDEVLGGGYRKGLHLVVGYSHNGKTQVLLRTIWENRDRPIVYFTADEDAELVINKLLSLATGEHVDEVFYWSGSRKASLLNDHFPYLAVDDSGLPAHEMVQLIQEAEQIWQQPVELCSYDYLELFGSARGQDAVGAIKNKLSRFKDMVRTTGIPWLILHQLNRQGAGGKPVEMGHLTLGGEQAAKTITACWREYFNPHLNSTRRRWEEMHPTIHVSVIKNKQRPALLPDGAQYAIDPQSGLIRPLQSGERLMTGMRDLG